jgi:hypothetical protein
MMGGVGALVTLELPADSPALSLPWIITIGPFSDDEEWEPVVCGPYERAHALALAEEIVADEELMAVVEPVVPHVSVAAIRDEIATARALAAEEEDDEADGDGFDAEIDAFVDADDEEAEDEEAEDEEAEDEDYADEEAEDEEAEDEEDAEDEGFEDDEDGDLEADGEDYAEDEDDGSEDEDGEDYEDEHEEHPGPPSPDEIRAGFVRIAARLTET